MPEEDMTQRNDTTKSVPGTSHCYLVLAGTFEEAMLWATEKSLPTRPSHRNGWIYASSIRSIHGIRDFEVVIVGTFLNRRDAGEIMECVESKVATGHAVEPRCNSCNGSGWSWPNLGVNVPAGSAWAVVSAQANAAKHGKTFYLQCKSCNSDGKKPYPQRSLEVRIKPIVWSEHRKPNNEISYDHCISETPFGRFILTWKSWKSQPGQDMGIGFDETPWNEAWYSDWTDIEEAKQAAFSELNRRVMMMFNAETG